MALFGLFHHTCSFHWLSSSPAPGHKTWAGGTLNWLGGEGADGVDKGGKLRKDFALILKLGSLLQGLLDHTFWWGWCIRGCGVFFVVFLREWFFGLRWVFLAVRSDVGDPSTAVTGRQQHTTDGRFIVSIITLFIFIIIALAVGDIIITETHSNCHLLHDRYNFLLSTYSWLMVS